GRLRAPQLTPYRFSGFDPPQRFEKRMPEGTKSFAGVSFDVLRRCRIRVNSSALVPAAIVRDASCPAMTGGRVSADGGAVPTARGRRTSRPRKLSCVQFFAIVRQRAPGG